MTHFKHKSFRSNRKRYFPGPETWLLLFFIFMYDGLLAQEDHENFPGEIRIQRVIGGYNIYRGGQQVKPRQLVRIMHDDPLSVSLMRASRAYNISATALGAAGGALVGIPLITAIAGGEPLWNLAYIGGALIVLSIPVAIIGTKKAYRSVSRYNAFLKTEQSSRAGGDFFIHFSAKGLGIQYRF